MTMAWKPDWTVTILGILIFLSVVLAFSLSIAGMIHVAAGRGKRSGMGLAITTLVLTILTGLLAFPVLFLSAQRSSKLEDTERRAEAEMADVMAREPRTYSSTSLGHFSIEEAWIDTASLPKGLSRVSEAEGPEALQKALVPAEMAADIEKARLLQVAPGNVLILGFQFKTDFARRRWTRDNVYSRFANRWPQILGGGTACIFLRHDGSPEGSAAAELLWEKIEKSVTSGRSKRP